MSFIHRTLLRFAGFASAESQLEQSSDSYINLSENLRFSQTDHTSKGQVVVATTPQLDVDYMTSQQLHEASQQALSRLQKIQD